MLYKECNKFYHLRGCDLVAYKKQTILSFCQTFPFDIGAVLTLTFLGCPGGAPKTGRP